jgi:hypothetical protein
MKAILFLLTFFISSVAAAQTEFATGKAYRYVQSYHDDKPFLHGTFTFKKKDDEIKNAYVLRSTADGFNAKELIYGIWIVDCDTVFYLNVYRYGYGFPKCYVKFVKQGNYYYFKAQPLLTPSQHYRIAGSRALLGNIGADITRHRATKEDPSRWYHVLNFSSGSVQTLNEEYVTDILADHPHLLKEFNTEENKSSIKTLKSYLEKINQEE